MSYINLSKSRIFLFLVLMATVSCSKTASKSIQSQLISDESEQIKEVLFTQQKAWNEGNLDVFMEGYLNDESLSFIGKSGVTRGWNQTLTNYKKGYPDKATMGILKFEILELQRLAADAYYMIGKYSLQREKDKPSGYFTLLWKKINGEWVIVSDHTSG